MQTLLAIIASLYCAGALASLVPLGIRQYREERAGRKNRGKDVLDFLLWPLALARYLSHRRTRGY